MFEHVPWKEIRPCGDDTKLEDGPLPDRAGAAGPGTVLAGALPLVICSNGDGEWTASKRNTCYVLWSVAAREAAHTCTPKVSGIRSTNRNRSTYPRCLISPRMVGVQHPERERGGKDVQGGSVRHGTDRFTATNRIIFRKKSAHRERWALSLSGGTAYHINQAWSINMLLSELLLSITYCVVSLVFCQGR